MTITFSINNFSGKLPSSVVSAYNKITDQANIKKISDSIANAHQKIEDVVGKMIGKEHLDFKMQVLYSVPLTLASGYAISSAAAPTVNTILSISIKHLSKWSDETKTKSINTLAIAALPGVIDSSLGALFIPLNALQLGLMLKLTNSKPKVEDQASVPTGAPAFAQPNTRSEMITSIQ